MIRTNYPETLSSWRQVWPFGAHPFSSPTKPAVEPTQDATVYDPLRPFPPSEPRRGPVLVFCDFPSRLAPALVRFDLPTMGAGFNGRHIRFERHRAFGHSRLGWRLEGRDDHSSRRDLKSDRPVSGIVKPTRSTGMAYPFNIDQTFGDWNSIKLDKRNWKSTFRAVAAKHR